MDDEELDLSVLSYDQVAGHFADRAQEIGDDFPNLLEPLLFASKAIMAVGRLNNRKSSSIHKHLEMWRKNCTWLAYCRGRLIETVAKLDSELQDMRSDLQDDVYKSIIRRNLRISDEKVRGELRKNKDFRKLDRQLSELRAILSHVQDHCDQYKLIKDVLVQESTLTKHMMAP